MEGPTKRHMRYGVAPSSAPRYGNPELATLGMKIRKAVADGHSLVGAHTYNAQFFANYAQVDQPRDENDYNRMFSTQSFQRPQRTCLPSTLSSPPALTSDGSTFQSGSNVSEWGALSVATTNLPQKPSLKRKMSDCRNVQMQSEPTAQSLYPSYDQFTAQNGQLSFNEDF